VTDGVATSRRSTWLVLADYFAYNLRVLRGRQRPVRFKDLPGDLQAQRVAVLLVVASAPVGWLFDAAWIGPARLASVLAFVALTYVAMRRARRDPVRFAPGWVGTAVR
jgi:hypothetical protein